MIHNEVRKVVSDVRIRQMRGGTSVTHAAMEALRSGMSESKTGDSGEFLKELEENCNYLATLRPFSVPLSNGIRTVVAEVQKAASENQQVPALKEALSDVTQNLERELREAVGKIAEIGARRLKDGDTILTHSHSSSVIAILRNAHKQGKHFRVFVTETRHWASARTASLPRPPRPKLLF